MTVQELFDLMTSALVGDNDLASDSPVELRIGDQVKRVRDAQIKYDRDTGKPVLVIHS